MLPKKTHREVPNPQISARHLADYMAATETARRTIARNCKYQSIARVVQHDEAKGIISNFIVDGEADSEWLLEQAQGIRDRLTDSDFERDLCDHNADYVERFAAVWADMELPIAERLAAKGVESIEIHGVKVTFEVHAWLQRTTKTNKTRVGAAMLRYAKGKPLQAAIGEWQSALLHGFLEAVVDEGVSPEHKLCLTMDAYAGACYSAPTDSVRRFRHMKAACESLAERWPKIKPPTKAVL